MLFLGLLLLAALAAVRAADSDCTYEVNGKGVDLSAAGK